MNRENKTRQKGFSLFGMKNPQPATWFVILLLLACVAAVVTGLFLNSQSK